MTVERSLESDGPTRDELRLRLYELLHEKVERERASRLTRATRGGALLAAVFGVAFLSGDLRFVALTPVLYGVVAMDGLKSTVRILHLNRHLVDVESELSETEPLYDWVTHNGAFGDLPRIEVADFDLNEIPTIALVVSVAAGYLALVLLSLRTWTAPVSGTPLTVPVSRDLLLVGYATFTLFLVVISAVGYLHFQRLSSEVATRHHG